MFQTWIFFYLINAHNIFTNSNCHCVIDELHIANYNIIIITDSLAGKKYYRPTEQGSEARVKERLRQIEAWKAERRKK